MGASMPIGAHIKAHKGEKMLIIAVSKIFDDNVQNYFFKLSTIKHKTDQSETYLGILQS